MPGPASSEEDRPPTNPAIQVRSSTEADGYFFTSGKYMRDTDLFETFLFSEKAKAPSTGRKADFTFFL